MPSPNKAARTKQKLRNIIIKKVKIALSRIYIIKRPVKFICGRAKCKEMNHRVKIQRQETNLNKSKFIR